MAGGTTTHYVHGLGGLLYGEYDNSGVLIREYVWLNGEPLAQILKSGGTETVTYLHTDHLATPRYGTNAAGTVVWTWDSGAFGKEAPTGTTTVNLRFPGQYFDAETTLNYNWHRYYDPATGRYITSDPLGLAAGLNTYGYVAQNPLGYIDRDGLELSRDVADFLRWLAEMGIDIATAEAQENIGILFQGWCQYTNKNLSYLARLAAFHETIGRLAWARVNPIPPLAKKVSKQGTATIKLHKNRHFSVEVKKGNQSLSTHQVRDGNKTRIVETSQVDPGDVIDSRQVDLPDAEAAWKRQRDLMDQEDLGPYDRVNNSCLSHCCDIAKHGCAPDVPEPTTQTAQPKWVKSLPKK